MPNRILREGILTSDRIDQLDAPAEVFYRRLMSKVDDHGLFDGRTSILRTSLYPLRVDRVREADITRWIAACEKAGLIALYQHDGKPYLQMLDTKWQARSEAKYPLPPASGGEQLKTVARNCTQPSATASLFGDEGGDVDVDDTPPPPAEAEGGFERFWSMWPAHYRKVARKQCQEKWAKKGCDAFVGQVLASLAAWIKSEAWAKDGGAFIPAPLVWLNQGRWEAMPEPATAPRPASGITVPSDAAARTEAEFRARQVRLDTPEARASNEAARRAAMEKHRLNLKGAAA